MCTPPCTCTCTRARLRTPLWRRRGGVRGLEDHTKTPLWGQVSSPLWAESTIAASDPFICSSKPNRKRFSGVFLFFSAFWAPAPPLLGSAPWWDRGGGKWDQPFLRLPLLTPPSLFPSIRPSILRPPLLSFPCHHLLALVLNPLSSLSVQPVCPSFLVCFLSSPPRPG